MVALTLCTAMLGHIYIPPAGRQVLREAVTISTDLQNTSTSQRQSTAAIWSGSSAKFCLFVTFYVAKLDAVGSSTDPKYKLPAATKVCNDLLSSLSPFVESSCVDFFH